MIVEVDFRGGPFDGPNEAKDEAGFSWVVVPFNSKLALYCRHRDGEPYRFYGIKESMEGCLEHVRSSRRLLQKAFDKGMFPDLFKGVRP